jgi:hypothetical protein
MNVISFRQYQMSQSFIKHVENYHINESDNQSSVIDSILKGLSRDLKFNYALVFTFGAGIKAMFPIVENLIKNENINIELTTENIVLLTMASLAITYLEESNNRGGDKKIPCQCDPKPEDCKTCKGTGMIDSVVSKEDARTILEELKLRGIGNGIVRKVVACFKSVGKFLRMLFRNSTYVISGLIDMLGYTMILMPTMNAISAVVGEYNLNFDTLPGNLLSIAAGVGTFLTKNIFNFVVNKIKKKTNIDVDTKHLDIPVAAKPYEISDGDEDLKNFKGNNLIKEQ